MPGLRMGGMQSGSLGSSRQGVAEGIASRGLTDSIANTAAMMSNAGYNTGMDNSTATLKSLPAVMTGGFMPAQGTSEVGAQIENRLGQEEAYRSNVETWQNAGPWNLLQNWAGLANSQSNPSSTTTSTGQQSGGGGGGGLGSLGTLASLGMMAFSMFSDRRLKENIKPVGKTDDGQKLYKYNYKGDPKTQIGLMADEVEKHHPEAVITHPSGYKMVNYDLATTGPIADLFSEAA